MTATTVHLLRHGEVHNPDGILYGRLPGFRLSGLGQAQADVAAKYLARRPVGLLVTSPLDRARQTAAPLATLTGLTPVIDERLTEAANAFEGRRVAGGVHLFANPANWWTIRDPLRPSWGEPYRQVAARVLAAARSAARRVERDAAADDGPDAGPAAEAVLVTHQLPIVAARRRAEGLHLYHDPRRRQCGLASVTSFVFDEDVVVRVEYAEPAAEVLPTGRGAGA